MELIPLFIFSLIALVGYELVIVLGDKFLGKFNLTPLMIKVVAGVVVAGVVALIA